MDKIPYWKRRGYKSEEKYREKKRRARKKARTPTGYYTLYLIYKKDKSEFYIGVTKRKLGYRKEKHFAKGTNEGSPFTGKSAKQYKAVTLHTCETCEEANQLEREVIKRLSNDVRMLNKKHRVA
jgi:hypothetical protein